MSRPWVLLGAGGHARSVADVLARAGGDVLAVAGGPAPWLPAQVRRIDHDARALELAVQVHATVVVAVGDNALRARLVQAALAAGADLTPLVAATATVAADAELGAGVVVLEHAHVGPGARLAAGVLVNTGAIVEHEVLVGAGTHVAPGAVLLGGVQVGAQVLVGAGATVLPSLTVAAGSVLAAGSVVIADVTEAVVLAGVPARPVGQSGAAPSGGPAREDAAGRAGSR